MGIVFTGALMAEYRQFYLCDVAHPTLSDDYGEAALARRVVPGRHAVIVLTARTMPVPVTVHLYEARPTLEPAAIDHAAECGLAAPSGEMLIAGLLDDAQTARRFAVPAGDLAVLVTFAGFGTLSTDGLDGRDAYAVHPWPGTMPAGVSVLRACEGP